MLFQVEMMYLGLETKVSKKTQASYLLVKMMDTQSSSIYEFYVPSDKLKLVTDVGQLKPFSPVTCKLGMTSFNNKPQIDLEGVQIGK